MSSIANLHGEDRFQERNFGDEGKLEAASGADGRSVEVPGCHEATKNTFSGIV